jgi:large subunit ribosomal protein L17
MFRNQLTALLTHERITTTVAKAKELRPMAERLVTLARTGTLANRRRILQTVADKEVVEKLFEDIAPRFAGRPGGYTRIVRLGRRHGDNAELAIIEFIDYEPSFDEEGGAKGKPSLMDRAKGMFGGRGGEEAAEPEAEETAAAEAEDAAAEPEASAADEEPVEAAPEEAADELEPEAAAEVTEEPAAEPVEMPVEATPEDTEGESKAEATSDAEETPAEPSEPDVDEAETEKPKDE